MYLVVLVAPDGSTLYVRQSRHYDKVTHNPFHASYLSPTKAEEVAKMWNSYAGWLALVRPVRVQ
jgi:hypothetical protein